jgi:hypothetical protein
VGDYSKYTLRGIRWFFKEYEKILNENEREGNEFQRLWNWLSFFLVEYLQYMLVLRNYNKQLFSTYVAIFYFKSILSGNEEIISDNSLLTDVCSQWNLAFIFLFSIYSINLLEFPFLTKLRVCSISKFNLKVIIKSLNKKNSWKIKIISLPIYLYLYI